MTVRTRADLTPLPRSLDALVSNVQTVQVLDRNGEPLSTTFTNHWNVHERVPLHEIPTFLQRAFILAEDRRFYEHAGVDWRARGAAVVTNIRNGRAIRGASTITEQVVRILEPRPRTIWSRWIEGWQAARLERAFGKHEILELYLNQVPYAANRRGVQQAARYYFARDLETLSKKEMLALAALVRAPTLLDLRRSETASEGAIGRLADAFVEHGAMSAAERDEVLAPPFALEAPRLVVSAPHFVRYVRAQLAASQMAPVPEIALQGSPILSASPLPIAERHASGTVITTLDSTLQAKVQDMLDERLRYLRTKHVENGAVLVVDHSTRQVLAWVVAGGGEVGGVKLVDAECAIAIRNCRSSASSAAVTPASHIDAVLAPRQPGSALKPFLYALALDNGWSAAQIIDDAPLTESTSGGLHSYQNYSRRFYGPVTLRDALGNSLNIPALKTLHHVGVERYLGTLRELGFAGLERHPDFYGDGIALGSGAVTLLELVQAYATIAGNGVFKPLSTMLHDASIKPPRRIYSEEAASLIANILSDSDARALEFGRHGVLTFPVQTAIKTGTSSDFHDAWAVGFNYRYVVGAWLGNLDRSPTDGVTGSTGPALLLRGVFAELTRGQQTRPLYLSSRLTRHSACMPISADETSAATSRPSELRPATLAMEEDLRHCRRRDEWFLPGTERISQERSSALTDRIRLRQPTSGLRIAFDPRLPADAQAFEFVVDAVAPGDRVEWVIDGRTFWSPAPVYRWPLSRGEHRVAASVWRDEMQVAQLDAVDFLVK